MGIVSPTLYEDLEGQRWRVQATQMLPQVPGGRCRSLGSGLRPREVEQGTRPAGTDSWRAGGRGAVVSGLVVDQPGIVLIPADDREPPPVTATEDAARIPHTAARGMVTVQVERRESAIERRLNIIRDLGRQTHRHGQACHTLSPLCRRTA
ncbi:hypothetical protein B1R27_34645 [Streptomyces sp. GKU 895]|nr:hypothetical protein B1R27_34645 [Streptomyces sp. GKU 895]